MIGLDGGRAIPRIVDSHPIADTRAIRHLRWHPRQPTVIADRAPRATPPRETVLNDRQAVDPPPTVERSNVARPSDARWSLDELGIGIPVFQLRTECHLSLATRCRLRRLRHPRGCRRPAVRLIRPGHEERRWQRRKARDGGQGPVPCDQRTGQRSP